jgi:uncharacterized small protein (DUF1192 family)
MAKDKTPELTDEELNDRLRLLREVETEFAEANPYVKEDGHDGVNAWLTKARTYSKSSTQPEPFAGNSVDLSRERILEFVAAWAVTSGEFQRWLHERVDDAPMLGGSGYSVYSREDRDAELARLHAEVAGVEAELERRRLAIERERLEAELAAITGSSG